MITGAIVCVFLIAMYCAGCNGEWGSVAVGAVIVVLLLALKSACVSNVKAYGNFVDYWSKGGPDGKR